VLALLQVPSIAPMLIILYIRAHYFTTGIVGWLLLWMMVHLHLNLRVKKHYFLD